MAGNTIEKLVFDKNTKKLRWPSKNASWAAISGPHGKGTLPSGSYIIERKKIVPYSNKVAKPYQDKNGKGFFVPITPTFHTSRDGFGIHPDGNVPGTLGCVGITEKAKNFYDTITATPVNTALVLEVK